MPVKTTCPFLFITACLILPVSLLLQGCENHTKPATATRSDTAAQSLGSPDTLRGIQNSPADSNKVLELFKNNPSIANYGDFSIGDTFRLNGYVFLLVDRSRVNCKFTYLLACKEGHILKCVELESNCDTEFSQASYSYKEFSRAEDTLFDIRLITEKVKDSSLIEGAEIKGHRSREDVPTVTDTQSVHFSASQLLSAKIPAWPAIWKQDW